MNNCESRFKQLLGDRIRVERFKRNWTLDDLSEASGLSKGHISMIENGQTKHLQIKTVRKIAKALDLSLTFLLEEE